MLLFHFQDGVKSLYLGFYLLPFYRRENKDTHTKQTRSQVLVKYLSLARAALGSMVKEAGNFAGSREPGVWLRLDKGNNRCSPPFILPPN